jgi:hypothetical protein
MIEKNSDDQPLDLTSLQSELTPSSQVEDRIISRLRDDHLIRPRSQKFRMMERFIAVAACLLFFVSGVLYQKSRITAAPVVSMSDSTFVLFLLEGAAYQQPQGEPQQLERISAYRNWAIDLRKQGIPVNGTKLRDERELLGKTGEERNDEQISGYFLIDAGSEEEALAIARKCPHLRYGGRIEVRRVHPV